MMTTPHAPDQALLYTLGALASEDPVRVAAAERDLEARCISGDADTQRAMLFIIYDSWAHYGTLTYPDFAWRVERVLRTAIATRTIRDCFFTMDEKAAMPAHAEFVDILDGMAHFGDEGTAAALVAAGETVSAEAMMGARQLRGLSHEGRKFWAIYWLGGNPFGDLTAGADAWPGTPVAPWANDPIITPARTAEEDWAAISSDLRKLSRRELLRFWMIDRWWDARGWFEDRVWGARRLWWRLQDWRAARRQGAE